MVRESRPLSALRARLAAGFLAAVALATAGCPDDPALGESASAASASPPPAASAAPVTAATLSPEPSAPVSESNPFGLPPARLDIGKKNRVFTFSDRMLAGAKLGSTLVLYAATVAGLDGDELIIEGRAGGPSYKVHAGYAIAVPDDAKARPGDPVVTEWNGALKHGVVTRLVKGRVGVRYTDMDARTPEGLLKDPRLIRQSDGLAAGSYAAMRDGDEWKHVLLVAPTTSGGTKRWLALGFGGAATLANEADLRPIPVKYTPKVGAEVWAEWVGSLRKGTVQSLGETGQLTVKFERAGRPVTVGWGLVMQPIRD